MKTLAEHEKQCILNALEHFGHNRTVTARALNISVRSLRMKLKEWGINNRPIGQGEVMESKTVCKFVCVSKTIRGAGENQTNNFEFTPVTGGTDENKQFWKWTPSGKLEFSCLNPSVDFVPGTEYMIEITPA